MPEGYRMSSDDWRKWADDVLNKAHMAPPIYLTMYDGLFGFGPWGSHYASSEDRALYAYFIAEFIDTEGRDA
jgi:hypothetical protein